MIFAQSIPAINDLASPAYQMLLASSIAGLLTAIASLVMAQAAKIRSDTAKKLARENSEKLDQVQQQTNSNLNISREKSDALQYRLDAMSEVHARLEAVIQQRDSLAEQNTKLIARIIEMSGKPSPPTPDHES